MEKATQKLKHLCTVLLTGYAGVAAAGELDQFTTLNQPLADSLLALNQLSNAAVATVIAELNKEPHQCDADVLHRQLRQHFNNGLNSELIRTLQSSASIDRIKIKKRHSIYRDITPFHGIALGIYPLNALPVAVSAEINVNGYRIGIDKLEHIFERGYAYYQFAYPQQDNQRLKAALQRSDRGEELLWGGSFLQAGMKSYADLAANFNGIRFWNDFLSLHDDPLSRELGPAISCHAGQWIQVRQINMADYIDDSLDETINCTKYSSRFIASRVAENIQQLGNQRQATYACPISLTRYREVVKTYRPYQSLIINEVEKDNQPFNVARIENFVF